ncbi:hypothetical protein [Yinghuangia seranimata]|uniref:hypothetical protein n=1 Tax=Yinghuangia seranimata TaxID=408067 RepID=UPI00248C1539|nr:hypothetical protein [Yinghuangia seranimata]MDI2126929.1 hypothetical protein [Yinghuangia seranimata]
MTTRGQHTDRPAPYTGWGLAPGAFATGAAVWPPAYPPDVPAHGRAWMKALALIPLWSATVFSMMILPLFALMSDPCPSQSTALICTAHGQALCGQIPWFGGFPLAVAGTLAILSRWRTLRYAAVGGWMVGLVVMWAAVSSIADTYHP